MAWTIQDWGAIGEIVGGVGVIATLIYLAVQMKQNTRQLKSDSYQRHLDNHVAQLRAVCLNLETVDVWVRGLSEYQTLSPKEQMAFHGAISGFLYSYFANYRLYEEGVLRYDEYEMWERDVIRLLGSGGGSQWWQEKKGAYWPDVVERLDKLMAEKGATTPDVETYFNLRGGSD